MDGVRRDRQGRHHRRTSLRRPGCPLSQLQSTLERFNGFARSGVDEDFHRGESAYDRYYGDPTIKPNPNLGEISHPPYYAAKMVPGDLGTRVASGPTCAAGHCVTTDRRSRASTPPATSAHR